MKPCDKEDEFTWKDELPNKIWLEHLHKRTPFPLEHRFAWVIKPYLNEYTPL
jgi:hypothetical protein